MDKWLRKIAAVSGLPEEVARQLRDVGYVVIERAMAHTKCVQLSEVYDAAVLAAEYELMLRKQAADHEANGRLHSS